MNRTLSFTAGFQCASCCEVCDSFFPNGSSSRASRSCCQHSLTENCLEAIEGGTCLIKRVTRLSGPLIGHLLRPLLKPLFHHFMNQAMESFARQIEHQARAVPVESPCKGRFKQKQGLPGTMELRKGCSKHFKGNGRRPHRLMRPPQSLQKLS